ncbi:uncharacterized protein PHA67_023157 [Liasis olivaceus]
MGPAGAEEAGHTSCLSLGWQGRGQTWPWASTCGGGLKRGGDPAEVWAELMALMQTLNDPDQDPPARPRPLRKLRFANHSSVQLVPWEGLSLATTYGLLAALMECASVGTLCVAVSMHNWIWVEPHESLLGPQPFVIYTFGVPYKMNSLGNATDAQYLYFFGKGRDVIKPTMITVCFLSLCCGVTAILLDYMQVQMLDKCQMTLVASLHLLSGIFTMVLIVICGWCFEKINQLFKEPEWKLYQMYAYFGESFFIGLLAFACAIWAIVLSLCAIKLSKEEEEISKTPDARQ